MSDLIQIFRPTRLILWVLILVLPAVGVPLPVAAQEGDDAPASVEAESPAGFQKRRLAVIHVFNSTPDDRLIRGLVDRLRVKFKQFGGDRFNIYNQRSISAFEIPDHQGYTFFQPVQSPESLREQKKKFLLDLTQKNGIDVLMLANLRPTEGTYELVGQLFDRENKVFTSVEKIKFENDRNAMAIATSRLVKVLLAYADPDGWINTAPLFADEKDKQLIAASQKTVTADDSAVAKESEAEEPAQPLSPDAFSESGLQGTVNFAGEERFFWEQWWFWAIIGGAVVAGAGVGTYFFAKPGVSDSVDIRLRSASSTQ